MPERYLIGNWKSNMTIAETKEWFQVFSSHFVQRPLPKELTVVLGVPFTVLATSKEIIEKEHLAISLAAQDVSPFGKGPYTGEISAEMIAELGTFVLIGHSERRQYFGETDEELSFQVLQAKSAGLTVIYCVSTEAERVPQSVDIVAYEPLEAIGTGKPEDVNTVSAVCKNFHDTLHKPIVYGGSISEKVVDSYIQIPDVQGLLIGGMSLDAHSFFHIGEQLGKAV
jgi:triosephosphate isomerase